MPSHVNASGKSPKHINPSMVALTISRYWNGAMRLAPILFMDSTMSMCPAVAIIPNPARKSHCNPDGHIGVKNPISALFPYNSANVIVMHPNIPAENCIVIALSSRTNIRVRIMYTEKAHAAPTGSNAVTPNIS